MKPYFELDKVKLYCADFLQFNELEDESVDLIVTSPPYNLGMEYEGEVRPLDEYLAFLTSALAKCYRLLKPDGRMCLNIIIENRKIGDVNLYSEALWCARKVGFKYKATIFWYVGNVSKRTAWGSFCSASAPAILVPLEAIIVLYKESWKKLRAGTSDITKEEFISYTYGLWEFPYGAQDLHPAAFPLELPKRCIKLFSYTDDLVLDPFVGSGTTLVASYLLRRPAVGIEIQEKYCKVAKRWLSDMAAQGILF